MKTLTTHINEALKIGKNLSKFSAYSCQPKNRDELIEIIRERLYKEGSRCDLNDIDVSLVDDLSGVFSGTFFNGGRLQMEYFKCEVHDMDVLQVLLQRRHQ